jgi:hypothetical protein
MHSESGNVPGLIATIAISLIIVAILIGPVVVKSQKDQGELLRRFPPLQVEAVPQSKEPEKKGCDWMYDKAYQEAVEADITQRQEITNTYGWANHHAEMSRTWSLLYLACKSGAK